MYIVRCGVGDLMDPEVASGYVWEYVFIRKKASVPIHSCQDHAVNFIFVDQLS